MKTTGGRLLTVVRQIITNLFSVSKLRLVQGHPRVIDLHILQLLDLENIFTTTPHPPPPTPEIPYIWCPSKDNVVKLNCDGVSKGNLGTTGSGGVFINHKGEILWTIYGKLGITTNTEVELQTMMHRLAIEKYQHFISLIVGGDSAMATLATCKLRHGSLFNKVTNNWRLMKTLHHIQQHISDLRGVLFQVVQRKAKVVADHLANNGIAGRDTLVSLAWKNIREGLLNHDCNAINQNDNKGCNINNPFTR